MARQYVRQIDNTRTELLNQRELFVQKGKGGARYYSAWLHDPEVAYCPYCGGNAFKTQDLFSKTYLDLISDEGKKKVIQLVYEFHKYKCLRPGCGHVFAKPVHFASRRDNVTFRLENEIARLVIRGLTYSQVAAQLNDELSRQAVGQIFCRWVKDRENHRRADSLPSKLLIISGRTKHGMYTAFLNLDEGIKIYDIVDGVGSGDISAVLLKNGPPKTETVLSDCNPTIVDTIRNCLPNALHVIPVEYWFLLVKEDFAAFAHDRLLRTTVKNKDVLIMTPPTELAHRTSDLHKLLEGRPNIKRPYEDFNRLRSIVFRRDEMWVYNELLEWFDSVDPAFLEVLSATKLQLEEYRQPIEAHSEHRDLVPENLFGLTSRFEEILADMNVFSDAVLKARILYPFETDLDHWSGIPLEDVISFLANK